MKKSISWKRIVAVVIILVFIPLAVLISWKSGSRKYYLTSMVVIILTLSAFLLRFEKRKPQAAEVVLIAVLCALTVVVRGVFIMFPQFMPAAAIIIIAGMAFGAETGFLTGSLGMFISNFMFGQGMWTCWQMFAYGLLGFIAGVCYEKKIIKNSFISIGIFSSIVTMFIVGPILDTCTLFTMSSAVNRETAITVYAAGVPVNIMHTIGTLAGLLLFRGPLFEKFERMKYKYGLMQ